MRAPHAAARRSSAPSKKRRPGAAPMPTPALVDASPASHEPPNTARSVRPEELKPASAPRRKQAPASPLQAFVKALRDVAMDHHPDPEWEVNGDPNLIEAIRAVQGICFRIEEHEAAKPGTLELVAHDGAITGLRLRVPDEISGGTTPLPHPERDPTLTALILDLDAVTERYIHRDDVKMSGDGETLLATLVGASALASLRLPENPGAHLEATDCSLRTMEMTLRLVKAGTKPNAPRPGLNEFHKGLAQETLSALRTLDVAEHSALVVDDHLDHALDGLATSGGKAPRVVELMAPVFTDLRHLRSVLRKVEGHLCEATDYLTGVAAGDRTEAILALSQLCDADDVLGPLCFEPTDPIKMALKSAAGRGGR